MSSGTFIRPYNRDMPIDIKENIITDNFQAISRQNLKQGASLLGAITSNSDVSTNSAAYLSIPTMSGVAATALFSKAFTASGGLISIDASFNSTASGSNVGCYIALFLDGKNIQTKLNYSGSSNPSCALSFCCRANLAPGPHTVEFKFKAANGFHYINHKILTSDPMTSEMFITEVNL